MHHRFQGMTSNKKIQSNIFRYGDITTGNWFKKFKTQYPDSVPIALDVYSDGWKVSKQHSTVGLYFTISNLPKDENWKVMHKFPICLFPPSVRAYKGVYNKSVYEYIVTLLCVK